MLAELDRAAARLHAAAQALNEALVKRADIGHVLRMRTAASAGDVLAFLPSFSHAHETAARAHAKETQRVYELISLIGGGKVGEFHADELTTASRGLQISYKALYFFIRALQDRLYTVAARLLRPADAEGQSMAAAFKNTQNPVRRFLDEWVPVYVDWFPTWREQRDRIKSGVSFSIAGPDDDLGILFDRFEAHGGVSVDLTQAVRVSHVVAALDHSAAVVEALVELAGRLTTSEGALER